MSYRILLHGTQDVFEADDGESILGGALRANVSLPHDCQLGGCGTCRIELIEGRVRYDELPLALTPEEESRGYALACQAMAMSDLVISPARVAAVLPPPERFDAVVRNIRAVGCQVVHLTMDIPVPPSFIYRPGQYMNIRMADGSTHSFSMASAIKQGRVDFHIRRIAGGRFTERGLAELQAGDTLEVELPLGSFCFHPEDDRPLLMVATGTGIAPIKAILESLMDTADCPPVALYWGTRTASDLYLHDEIPAWGPRLYEFRYVPVLSRGDGNWNGRRGYVQDAVVADLADLSEHAIYLCGSPDMIHDAKRAFLAHGACAERIYAEGFTLQKTESSPAAA